MELDIPSILEALEANRPDHVALIHRGRQLTRADLGTRTRRLANVLIDAGLGARGDFGSVSQWESIHDHVAVYLHNRPEYLEAMLGSWKARAVPINVNYRYVAGELAHILTDSRSRAVIFSRQFGPTLGPVIAELEHPPEVLLWVEDGSEAPLVRGALEYEATLADVGSDLPTGVTSAWSGDDLYICYTGGTTGRPKGASWRQADFLVGALGLRHDSGEEFDSIEDVVEAAANRLRCLPAPPFMHGAAHWNALSCWADGGTVVIQGHGERIDPTDIVETIINHDVNSLLVVGDPVARPLIDHLRSNPAQPRSLRFILSGGAVLSADTRAALIELMPGVTVVDVLGSTESGRQGIARINDPAEADAAFTPSTDSVVLDADRQHVLAPGDDETGWLARSGRVPLGYLGDPERTAATFPIIDGLRYAVPGDRARWLSNGHVQLLGRDSVCINTGGEKVFVEEVEQSLLRHPAVLDVVVCGRPSRRWGEEVTAIVSLRSGARASDEELIAVAAETVARYKLPKAVIRVPTVQRSPSGKADYRWARAVANNEITPWSQLRSE